jgi:hypothetical protein
MNQSLPSRDELHRLWLDDNARLPNPLPVCPDCNVPFMAGDADDYDPRLCSGCGTKRVLDLVRELATGCTEYARRKALKGLRSLATR